MMRASYWTRTVSVAIFHTSLNSRMTYAVDDSSDAARSLEPPREAPSVADCGLMVSGSAIVGKRAINKRARGKGQKAVGSGDRIRCPLLFHTLLRLRLPLRPLLLQHLINSVFPDNENRAAIEKFFK
jgi:hypothetical protein